MTNDLQHRLSKAKTRLILRHPFIGTMALKMPFEITDAVPTAAVDGFKVYFNPEFCASLTDDQLEFLVAHECLHPMLEHNFRRKDRHADTWNVAADYVINQLLHDEGIGRFIDGGCLDRNIYDAGNGMTEKIYDNLPQQQGVGRGGIGQDVMDAQGSPAEIAEQQAAIKVAVSQAAQAARMAGKLSGNLNKLVNEIVNSRIDWRSVLRNFVVKTKDDQRSWARFNRRLLPQGVYYPARSGEMMGEIALACDCSGSISDQDYVKIASEMRALHADLRPSKLHVVYFDHKVLKVETFEPDDYVEVRRLGGGGTAFAPIWSAIDEVSENLQCCAVLTDLYCSDFGDDPGYPVLWMTTGATNAPFGETIEVKD